MLYRIIRPLAKIALRTTFRKIYFSNEDLIPWDKPIILAANHPSIFIEPCLLATHLPKPLYFLARGNLFKNNFYTKLLNGVHILPIFRMKDGGYSKLKNNFTTLEKSFDALKDHKPILIMAEGRCIQEKRLRKLRKGTARLAFGSVEKHGNLDIQIIPVGVNYTYPNLFRSEVMIDFGPPIAIRDYFELYSENQQEAIKKLNSDLEEQLRERIVVIDKASDDQLTEVLLQQYRNDNPDKIFPIVCSDENRLEAEIDIARKVNRMSEFKKDALKIKIAGYLRQLKHLKLDDWGLANPLFAKPTNLIILILGFLPFLLGFLGNFLPFRLSHFVMDKKVKEPEEKMSVGVAVGIVAVLTYYSLLVAACFAFGYPKMLIFVALLPIWGFFSLIYKEYYNKHIAAYRFQKVPNAVKTELAAQRRAIQAALSSGYSGGRQKIREN